MFPDCALPMRRFAQRLLLVACSLSLALTGSGCGALHPSLGDGPVAVVLLQTTQGSELVVVDLESFAVARRVRLRSLALSIDGDATTRTVVTAQCGGPGPAADSAAGVYFLDGPQQVRYIELEAPNPTSVAIGDGQAFIVHGFEQRQGLVTSRMDLQEFRVRPGAHLASTAGRPQQLGGRVFLPMSSETDAPGEDLVAPGVLASLDGGSVSNVATLPVEVTTVLGSDVPDAKVFCVGPSQSPPASHRWMLLRVDPGSGDVLAQADLPAVEKGVFEGCSWGDDLVLADADGLDLDDPGSRMLVVDSVSLEPRRIIEIEGMPAAMSTWRGKLIVVDGVNGRLMLFAPGTSSAERVLELGGNPGGTADLVVFDAASSFGG